MPVQEIYLDQIAGNGRYQVIKTYDVQLAREAFDSMDQTATDHLSRSLDLGGSYDASEIPADPVELADPLWDEMLDSAREDGQTASFFVVRQLSAGGEVLLYVSGDWPSAEGFVRNLAAD